MSSKELRKDNAIFTESRYQTIIHSVIPWYMQRVQHLPTPQYSSIYRHPTVHLYSNSRLALTLDLTCFTSAL